MSRSMTRNLQADRRFLVAWAVEPIGRLLSRTSISPNHITVIAFVIGIGAAFLVSRGILLWGGIALLFSGLFDLLDGALARAKSKVTKFGGVLDSTFDRVCEALIFLALMYYFVLSGHSQSSSGGLVILSGAGLVGSFMISYIKARAEGLGIECNVGIFTRAERVILLSLGLFLNQLIPALALLVVLSLVTIFQRLHQVWKYSGK